MTLYEELKEKYLTTPYEALVPTSSDDTKNTWKFNSLTHFLNWVEYLDKNFEPGTDDEKYHSGSHATGSDSERFTLSKDFEDAFRVIDGVSFDDKHVERVKSIVRNVRQSTKYAEEGYEIDVGEYVAGSDKYWLESTKKKSITRIIDEPMFINVVYRSGTGAEEVRVIGQNIIAEIYKRGVVPRKLIISFVSEQVRDGVDKHEIFVDVSFNDLHGLAKLLHPSLFRRIIFRMYEMYSDLNGFYGTYRKGQEGGLLSIQNTYDGGVPKISENIDVFLGTIKR